MPAKPAPSTVKVRVPKTIGLLHVPTLNPATGKYDGPDAAVEGGAVVDFPAEHVERYTALYGLELVEKAKA